MPKELTPHQTKTHHRRAGNKYVSGWVPEGQMHKFNALTAEAEEGRIVATKEIEAYHESRKK